MQNTPICPKCGAYMTLRTAKKGRYSGRRFYGCSRWPDCNGIINYNSNFDIPITVKNYSENYIQNDESKSSSNIDINHLESNSQSYSNSDDLQYSYKKQNSTVKSKSYRPKFFNALPSDFLFKSLMVCLMIFFIFWGIRTLYLLNTINVYQKTDTLECKHTYSINNLAYTKSGNVKLSLKNAENFVSNKLGKAKVTIVATNGKETKEFEFEYNIVDHEAPKIICDPCLTLYIGESKDAILNSIKITDNVDKKLKPTIEGDFSLDEFGYYEVRVRAKDKSNNEAVKHVNIKVLDYGDISWNETRKYYGCYKTVVGPYKSSFSWAYMNFINIGKDYPNKNRFQAVIPEKYMTKKMIECRENLHDNELVKVSGVVESYEGVAQIRVTDVSQIHPTGIFIDHDNF